ncbi:endoribonuclease dcr-1 [Lepidopterella palustris CBS 459.81]|uniref:Dicer-like protein 1 n=1 Tax=Lepidopterella palustris CBS 459.81 TaxID=1314670 RepID=A0A8E2DXX8_9PEZI|nr:endoribonuclease dcr-1 [Lepidopterella palustris CBS 459.81]
MTWSAGLAAQLQSESELTSDDNSAAYVTQDENEDSDIDHDFTHAHGPKTSSEKRKAQNEIFKAWASKKTEAITAEEIKEVIRGTEDESLSIKEILAKQEASSMITNPRDYQTELFQKAKGENIIAVLDTGSGKTHIATLLLRYVIDEELRHRADGKASRISFFLVNSINLVFQQANVLRCGLDHNVEGICGAMGCDLWVKKTWDKHFTNNMVVVCTADVLVQCLMHSFISIEHINLLIFDEAHHAKKNHSYARIIKDYYLAQEDQSKRPKIFGMTASPVDAKVDVKEGARELEKLLHSKIATTSDLSLIRNNISRPTEEVVLYSRLLAPFETTLYQQLKARFGGIKTFQKFFDTSKKVSSELGRWATDMYWSFAFSEEEALKIEMREERKFHAQKIGKPIAKLDEEIALLREAAQAIKDHGFGTPEPNSQNLSTKVLLLHEWLQLYFSRTSDSRCIVFVECRHTARLLHLIFSHLGGPHLHGGMLVGVNSTIGDLNISLRQQVLTVAAFRKGELNCLFATSVAEEGLDIPQCNLIVRFDLYRTMISYVQSRGRARHKNSKYLHMVEMDNATHRQAVFEARSSESLMRAFCQALPADRFLLGNDEDMDKDMDRFLIKERGFRTYTDPTTGAKLTYGSSLGILAHFCSCLPQGNEATSQASYVLGVEAGKFVCEVILPEASPVHSAIGRPATKKSVAKRSAAFEACILLRKGKFLDGNLLPIYAKQLPAMRNARLALDAKKKNLYDMRIKPTFWEQGRGTLPTTLFLTTIDVTAGLERPHQPIGLLTRVPLPQLPPFPIYLNDGRPTEVRSTPLISGFNVSEDILEQLTTVSLRVFKDIFAKVYEHDSSKITYWLVPLKPFRTTNEPNYESPANLLDWDGIHEISKHDEYRWTPEMENSFLKNRFLVDIWAGGRRFFSVGVAPGMKPEDPVPANAPRHKFSANILDYSISLWTKSRALRTWDLSQPVVEAEQIPFRRNLLAPAEDKELYGKIQCFLCPQPIRISALPVTFVVMCYVFPAIIHRFDSYLISLDACELLGLDIGPELALEALTKDSDNSEEHEEEKINMRSGMGPNYERLEFMGDCFLKMATSISVFVQQPDENEFEFHVRRMCLLCNKNLFKTAQNLKLYEYIRTMAFSRRTWYPEGLKLLEGKGAKKPGAEAIKHALGDKSVADVCEAFIGAAFIQHNERNGVFDPKKWDQAVKAVKVMVSSEDHMMETWADYFKAYTKPKYQIAEATASQLDLAAQIQQKHQYIFRYPRLLRSAFIHPSQSFMWEKIPHYQRLEFLGDSLLDMVFVTHLFYRYPDKDPQWLTEHKMPMVSNKFLGTLCVKLNFHVHLRHNNAVLQHQIQEYVTEVQEAEREAKGSPDYWTTVSEPPKCLADIMEAYVGALFVDSDFDFNEVQRFFDEHIKAYFEDMSVYDTFANNHPTTKLTKLLNINLGCREWRMATRLCESAIPGARPTVLAMVLIHWNIVTDGSAVSGRYARIKASNATLDMLEGLPQYEFRKRFRCDCSDEVEGAKAETAEEVEDRVREAVGSAI